MPPNAHKTPTLNDLLYFNYSHVRAVGCSNKDAAD